MSKSTEEDELERRELSLRLDQELEDTFPASDALKITRTTAGQARKARNARKGTQVTRLGVICFGNERRPQERKQSDSLSQLRGGPEMI